MILYSKDDYPQIHLPSGHNLDLHDLRQNSGFTFEIIDEDTVMVEEGVEELEMYLEHEILNPWKE